VGDGNVNAEDAEREGGDGDGKKKEEDGVIQEGGREGNPKIPHHCQEHMYMTQLKNYTEFRNSG
jgi:hypothetical protein